MENKQKEILVKGRTVYEMCLEKNSFDCVLGFVEDQIKLGRLDLMKVFFYQLQSAPCDKPSLLEKEALLEIEKRILDGII